MGCRILKLIFAFGNLICPHLSIIPGCVPVTIACPGREIHSMLAGMSPPIRLLNVSNLSHGGSTHILPTYPAPPSYSIEHPSYVPPCSPRYRACAAGGTTEDR